MKLFGLNITRASYENPNNPIDYDDISYSTDSGVTVDEEATMGYAPVWRGVSLISRDVAKMPLNVFARNGDSKQKAASEPGYKLVRRKPNSYMNAFNFKMFMQTRALLTGNGYALIQRNGAGQPVALWPLNDYNVCPVLDKTDLYYEVETDDGRKQIIESRNIFHLRGIGGRIQGYSLIEYAQNTVGMGLASQKYTNKYFSNGSKPQIILKTPATLSEDAQKRLKKSFGKAHQGIDNAFNTAILEEGLDFSTVPINNRDAQLEELTKLTQKEVAQFLGIPLGKLGESESVSYNSAEQENQSYLDNALDPWLVAWEQECWDKLLSARQKDNDLAFFEFNRESLVRMNTADKTNLLNTTVMSGIMTLDEARSKLNMNPYPNEWGSVPYRPLNMGYADDEAEAEETDAETVEDTARAVLVDALRRLARRYKVQQDKAAQRDQEYDPDPDWYDSGIRLAYDVFVAVKPGAEPFQAMRHRFIEDIKRTGADVLEDEETLKQWLNKDF